MKQFTIPFVGLKLGEHHFKFDVANTFFEYFGYDEFNDAAINLEVLLNKKTTLLEFTLNYRGSVNVQCDLTNEPYDQPIKGAYHFVVKFGESFNDENEELLIIPHGSYEVNIQQYIYESIILSLPARRLHPGIEDGTLDSEILHKLEELSPKAIKDKKDPTEETDPTKRKISKTRRDKRRTHYKAIAPTIATDPTTGESHLFHRAHWHEGKLYYRGQIVIDAVEEVEE